MIERMGVGQRGDLLRLTPSDIDRFLGSCDRFRDNIAWHAAQPGAGDGRAQAIDRSEEHTSELQSLMRISYAVFCLKKKKTHNDEQQATPLHSARKHLITPLNRD